MIALSRNVSRKHAMEMLLTGEMISAEEASRIGLVNRVVASQLLRASVDELAQRIAGKSKAVTKIGKEAFYRQIDMPLADAYDYAWESFSDFENMEGRTTHQRTLFYLRDKFWIILDKVISDRPRQINALWHWHPDCEVERFGRHLVKTLNDHGNLYLQSLSSIDWQLDQVKGQEEPVLQGWYSEEYNKVEPNTASIFTADVDREATMIWFILPYETEQPDVRAEVKSEDSYGVSLRITVEDEAWHLEIPFKNTNKISVEQQ
jgi:hypothetical protein